MWHMSAINKCITSAATTGLFLGGWGERGPFTAAGLSFKARSLPLCIPLHWLAHFTVPKKF